MHIDLPELVTQRALANGAAGQQWLEDLPAVIERLADGWQLTVGSTFGGGTAGCVVEATNEAGTPVVLKVAMPLDSDEVAGFHRSVVAHRLAAGRGCARLLAVAESDHAMLLERLGSNLDDLGLAVDEILEAIAVTLPQFWRPVDDDALLHGSDKAEWLAAFIVDSWNQLDRPCPRTVVDRALDHCAERATALRSPSADLVLVHGDAHGWNTLSAGDGTFKLVDPEGLVSERAHDLAVPMREYNEPLLAGDTARLARERAELLAAMCDVDPDAVWQWGYIERVSTGLANLRDFDGDEELMFLEVAERCL